MGTLSLWPSREKENAREKERGIEREEGGRQGERERESEREREQESTRERQRPRADHWFKSGTLQVSHAILAGCLRCISSPKCDFQKSRPLLDHDLPNCHPIDFSPHSPNVTKMTSELIRGGDVFKMTFEFKITFELIQGQETLLRWVISRVRSLVPKVAGLLKVVPCS